MIDNNTVWVSMISASSALLGVILTQIITAINTKSSDKRKYASDIDKIALQRKIEVGEHYYRVTGSHIHLVDATIHAFTKLPELIREKIPIDTILSNSSLEENISNDKKVAETYPLGNFINLYYDISESFDSNSKFGITLKDLGLSLISSFPKPREFAEDVKENKISAEIKEQKLLELTNHLKPIIQNLQKQKEEYKINMEIVKNEINLLNK
ncbi:MAG: hypothetical protein ACRYGB_01555 [Janthinobacterium lividum]